MPWHGTATEGDYVGYWQPDFEAFKLGSGDKDTGVVNQILFAVFERLYFMADGVTIDDFNDWEWGGMIAAFVDGVLVARYDIDPDTEDWATGPLTPGKIIHHWRMWDLLEQYVEFGLLGEGDTFPGGDFWTCLHEFDFDLDPPGVDIEDRPCQPLGGLLYGKFSVDDADGYRVLDRKIPVWTRNRLDEWLTNNFDKPTWFVPRPRNSPGSYSESWHISYGFWGPWKFEEYNATTGLSKIKNLRGSLPEYDDFDAWMVSQDMGLDEIVPCICIQVSSDKLYAWINCDLRDVGYLIGEEYWPPWAWSILRGLWQQRLPRAITSTTCYGEEGWIAEYDWFWVGTGYDPKNGNIYKYQSGQWVEVDRFVNRPDELVTWRCFGFGDYVGCWLWNELKLVLDQLVSYKFGADHLGEDWEHCLNGFWVGMDWYPAVAHPYNALGGEGRVSDANSWAATLAAAIAGVGWAGWEDMPDYMSWELYYSQCNTWTRYEPYNPPERRWVAGYQAWNHQWACYCGGDNYQYDWFKRLHWYTAPTTWLKTQVDFPSTLDEPLRMCDFDQYGSPNYYYSSFFSSILQDGGGNVMQEGYGEVFWPQSDWTGRRDGPYPFVGADMVGDPWTLGWQCGLDQVVAVVFYPWDKREIWPGEHGAPLDAIAAAPPPVLTRPQLPLGTLR